MCLSLSRIARVPIEVLRLELIGLAAHELAHFHGADEAQAVAVQQAIVYRPWLLAVDLEFTTPLDLMRMAQDHLMAAMRLVHSGDSESMSDSQVADVCKELLNVPAYFDQAVVDLRKVMPDSLSLDFPPDRPMLSVSAFSCHTPLALVLDKRRDSAETYIRADFRIIKALMSQIAAYAALDDRLFPAGLTELSLLEYDFALRWQIYIQSTPAQKIAFDCAVETAAGERQVIDWSENLSSETISDGQTGKVTVPLGNGRTADLRVQWTWNDRHEFRKATAEFVEVLPDRFDEDSWLRPVEDEGVPSFFKAEGQGYQTKYKSGVLIWVPPSTRSLSSRFTIVSPHSKTDFKLICTPR